jgi:hypothetical protein
MLTGSATRKPRPVGGDKGPNKKQTFPLPGSPALRAGSFTFGWTLRGMALTSLLLAALTAAGCGKKADPIPPRLVLPPVIADLTADSVDAGILLGWSTPGPIGRIDHFRILRSAVSADQACPGCPQVYMLLATPKAADPALQRAGEGMFRYVDAAVTAGRFYSYRVSACDSRKFCGEPSAPAGLFTKQPGADRGK